MGNVMILKPSEKVPLTMHRVASLFRQAGLPDGVFNMIQGTRTAVESIIDHPQVKYVNHRLLSFLLFSVYDFNKNRSISTFELVDFLSLFICFFKGP
jgi:hypothetical protein